MRLPISRSLTQAVFLLVVLVGSLASMSFALQSSIVIPSDGSIYYQPEAEVLFQDEFESGDFSSWSGTYSSSGGDVMVTAVNPYEGAYHGLFQTDAVASGVKYAHCYYDLSPSVSEVYARGYFYLVDGLPLDDSYDRFGLIGFEVNGQLQCTFRVHRSGGVDRFNIVGLNGAGTVEKSTDAVYPVEGQWYCVEFYIRVHDSGGEYRAWINGVERISITNVNTARYGVGVNRVRFGLTATLNVQHFVEVYCDSVVISTRYVGQLYKFAVIGSAVENPAIRNFYWLFGNQSISYRCLVPSEVTCLADVDCFDGLVVWGGQGAGYNAAAIRQFAQSRVVISDVWDFCSVIYPSLSDSLEAAWIGSNGVEYLMDWGNFREGDRVWMMNETGGSDYLVTVVPSGLESFDNVTVIAERVSGGPARVVLFHMNGTRVNSGFYVMDLDATSPETEWTGIWHVFPAVKMVKDFPTGKYARWMADGSSWWDLTRVYNHIDTLVSENGDVAEKWVIGYSVEGREIPAIVIGEGARYAIIDGCIHGNEKTATFACLRIAELLIEYCRYDPFWQLRLAEYTVIIVPVLNPDGFNYNTRRNANGIDLNRQFPPQGTTTEPEAWALRNLMGNYTPTIYVNIHEGSYHYPLHMIYGAYEQGTNKSITISTMQQANQTFVGLKHWGWFTEQGSHVWIGKVDTIVVGGGAPGMAIDYASWAYGSSCMLLETFLWSPTWGARKCLWGLDYYSTVILTFIQQMPR